MSEASKIFANAGLRDNASFLLGLHPHASDYLSQAPVLVFAFGVKANTRADRLYIASRIGGAIERGEKLPAIMRKVGLPLPLRKLGGNVLRPKDAPAIRYLKTLPPSVLSQAIPERGQKNWLDGLDLWIRRFDLRDMSVHHFEWIAKTCPPKKFEAQRAGECADFVISNPGTDIARWSWRRMLQEVELWHDRTAAIGSLRKLPGAIQPTTRIDLSDWPDTAEVDGYEFFKLATAEMLMVEGRRMRHCVASYIPDVLSGKTSIFSIREGMIRVGTLQVKAGRVVQLKGFANRAVSAPVKRAAASFVKGDDPPLTSGASKHGPE